jgi:hypothetical protein
MAGRSCQCAALDDDFEWCLCEDMLVSLERGPGRHIKKYWVWSYLEFPRFKCKARMNEMRLYSLTPQKALPRRRKNPRMLGE